MTVACHLPGLPCITTLFDCYICCIHLFFQIKSYARVHGQTNENDKGYISISYYEDSVTYLYKGSRFSTYAHFYRVVVLCAFLFLNVLTPIALAKLACLYYPTIRAKSMTGELTGFLYWATAIMAFLCNTLYSVTSTRHHILRSKPAITASIMYLSYNKSQIHDWRTNWILVLDNW